MAAIDLEKMNLGDLKKLQKDIDRVIQSRERRRRIEAMAALEAKAKEMGFRLSDLTGAQASANLPKYAHPENPTLTWTGRGRRPAWIKEGLEAGKSLDDFLVIKK